MVIILLKYLLNIHTDQSNYALTILANITVSTLRSWEIKQVVDNIFGYMLV